MKMKKQRGFALIEVLLAALVMIVGGVAYMKLQQTGLRYSYNNYMRIQGETIARNFIEQLRGNVDITQNIVVSGTSPAVFFGTLVGLPSNQYNASAPANVQGAYQSVFIKQLKDVRAQMKLASRLSVLCYRVNINGYVRVTYRWTDNEDKNKKAFINQLRTASSSLCPRSFEAVMSNQDNSVISNMVDIYAQL